MDWRYNLSCDKPWGSRPPNLLVIIFKKQSWLFWKIPRHSFWISHRIWAHSWRQETRSWDANHFHTTWQRSSSAVQISICSRICHVFDQRLHFLVVSKARKNRRAVLWFLEVGRSWGGRQRRWVWYCKWRQEIFVTWGSVQKPHFLVSYLRRCHDAVRHWPKVGLHRFSDVSSMLSKRVLECLKNNIPNLSEAPRSVQKTTWEKPRRTMEDRQLEIDPGVR